MNESLDVKLTRREKGAQSYFLVCAAGHGIKPGRIRCGVTYGLRKTRIPPLSVLIISLCSGLVLGASMQAGALLQRFLSPSVASVIGAAILILLGLWSLYQQVRRKASQMRPVSSKDISKSLMETKASDHQVKSRREVNTAGQVNLQRAVFSLEIPKVGVVIQILRSPSKADLDDSGKDLPVGGDVARDRVIARCVRRRAWRRHAGLLTVRYRGCCFFV